AARPRAIKPHEMNALFVTEILKAGPSLGDAVGEAFFKIGVVGSGGSGSRRWKGRGRRAAVVRSDEPQHRAGDEGRRCRRHRRKVTESHCVHSPKPAAAVGKLVGLSASDT